ncbi:MAG: hypothetical protein OEM04_00415 [Flavobacteriaceae bacterium]|nr:hypothetical protein [Flavobacteriaceae bacterium]
MTLLKKLFEFYIYSNLHVSLAVFCLAKLTLHQFDIEDNVSPYFAFFATVIAYNFIRIYNFNEINPEIAAWIKSHKRRLILLNLICLIASLELVIKLKYEAYIMLIPLTFTTFFYSVPFSHQRRNLRSIASLKLFLIAVTWAGMTVLFPLKNNGVQFSTDVWLVFLQRFLFIMAITIPFDIRDIDYDNPAIKTLPQTLGIQNSKLVGTLLLLLFFMIDFFRDLESESTILITLMVTVISVLFLNSANKDQSEYYSSFWVESIPVLWFLLVYFIE